MQTETAPSEVARGSRFDNGKSDEYRQNCSARSETKEAHVYRSVREGSPRATFSQAAKALGAGDHVVGGQSPARERGSARVVLQPAAEGEAHDAAQHARGRDDGGHGPRALRARRRARQPAAALALAARPVAAARAAAGRAHAGGALTVRPVGAAAALLCGAALAALRPPAGSSGPEPCT